MKRVFIAILAPLLALVAGAAERGFTHTLDPAAFAAAGLQKLTAEERAYLDALVQEYRIAGGATRDAAAAAAAELPGPAERPASPPRAEVTAAPVVAEQGERGSGRRVRIAPGTEVEFTTIESRIAGEFRGWRGRTVFTLENGQRWQTDGSSSYVTPPVPAPAVKIEPGLLGSFWMTVEGVNPRVRVTPVGGR
jgi:hypothetical protein